MMLMLMLHEERLVGYRIMNCEELMFMEPGELINDERTMERCNDGCR